MAAIRRWVAIAMASGLVAVALRWGTAAVGADIRAAPGGTPLTAVAVGTRALALTFELPAPAPALPSVLGALTQMGVSATFFVSDAVIHQDPAAIAQLIDDGEEVELLAPASLAQGAPRSIALLRGAAAALSGSAGKPRFVRLRPGGLDPQALHGAREAGLVPVVWSLDPADWAQPGAGVIAGRVLGGASPGGIVRLMVTAETAQALPAIVDGLRGQGWQFLTLDGLLALAEVQPPPGVTDG